MAKPCVLVVIDDVDLSLVLGDIISGAGVDVVSAFNGREALGKLIAMAELPCLAFVDVHMPIMNGVEFIEEVRQHPRLKPLRICSMSCSAGRETTTEFLSLPCSIKDLTDIVDTLCCRKSYVDEGEKTLTG